MDFLGIPLFSAMKNRLNYDSQRQSALAQNIANVDTPGYRAKDVKAPDFKAMTAQNLPSKLAMNLTDPKHMTTPRASGAFKVENRKNTDELNPNGNNVSVEEEMMKVGENQADYQKTLNLYRKTIIMFNTAIGHNGA